MLAAVPFGSLWVDWLHAVTNVTNVGWTHNLWDVPLTALPIVGLAGRRR